MSINDLPRRLEMNLKLQLKILENQAELNKLLRERTQHYILDIFKAMPDQRDFIALANQLALPQQVMVEALNHIITTRKIPRSNFLISRANQKFLKINLQGVLAKC